MSILCAIQNYRNFSIRFAITVINDDVPVSVHNKNCHHGTVLTVGACHTFFRCCQCMYGFNFHILAYAFYVASGFAVGQKPVIPDTVKLLWQHMVQKTLNESGYRQGGDFPSGVLSSVLEPELDLTVFVGNDPVVTDSASVGVPSNILYDFFRARKRRFGENHRFFGGFVVKPLTKSVRISQFF